MNRDKLIRTFIISVFVLLYLMVSGISMVNSFDFFHLSQGITMSWILAISFEVGSACSLASLIILDRVNKNIVWMLFILLTIFQIMNNVYHTFIHLNDYQGWIELFGLNEEDQIFQKRILSIISGAILPLVALGFIKSLVDYIKPSQIESVSVNNNESISINNTIDNKIEMTSLNEVKDIPLPLNEIIKPDIINNISISEEPQIIDYKKYVEEATQEIKHEEFTSDLDKSKNDVNENKPEIIKEVNLLEDTYNRYLDSLEEKDNMKHKLQMDYSHPGINPDINSSKIYDSKNNPN